MSRSQGIRAGTAWTLVGGLLRRGGQFIAGIVLARLLVPEDFGLLVTIQIFTGVAAFITAGGMSDALVREPQVDARDFRVVFTAQLAIGTLIYALFFVAAPPFARWYDTPIYAELLRVSALVFILRPWSNVPRARLKRDMRFRDIATTGVISLAVSSLISISMAWAGYGVWSLVAGGVVGAVVNAVAFSLQARWRPGLALDLAVIRRLGSYGAKSTLKSVILHLRAQTANFVIGRELGAAPLGLFNKGDSLAKLPQELLTGSLYPSLFRSMSKAQENLNESRYLFLHGNRLLALYSWPVYTGLMWAAAPFIEVLYTDKWLAAAVPLQILCLVGYLRTVGSLAGAVSAAHDRLSREIVIQVEGLILLALACVIGLHWGMPGVAAGVTLAIAPNMLRVLAIATRTLQLRFADVGRALRPVILLNLGLHAALAAGYALLAILVPGASPLLRLLTLTAIGVAAYGGAFLLIPIPSLAGEAARWRRRLHLAA